MVKLKWREITPKAGFKEWKSNYLTISQSEVMKNLNKRHPIGGLSEKMYGTDTKLGVKGFFTILKIRNAYQLEFNSKYSYYFPGSKVRYKSLEGAKTAARKLVVK